MAFFIGDHYIDGSHLNGLGKLRLTFNTDALKCAIFLFLGLMILSGCNKKDDCVPGALSIVMVGVWNVNVFGSSTGQVEFKEDGTLVDEDDTLVGGEVGGLPLDEKTYLVVSDQLFTATAASGNSSLTFDFDVTSFTCDEIVLDLFGIQASLTRR